MIRGTKKAQLLLDGRELELGAGKGFLFERELENPLQAVDIDQIKRQRPLTGGIDSLRSVSFRQPEQLLGLAQTAPGELAGQ